MTDKIGGRIPGALDIGHGAFSAHPAEDSTYTLRERTAFYYSFHAQISPFGTIDTSMPRNFIAPVVKSIYLVFSVGAERRGEQKKVTPWSLEFLGIAYAIRNLARMRHTAPITPCRLLVTAPAEESFSTFTLYPGRSKTLSLIPSPL